MNSIDVTCDSRIWVLAASLAFRRFNLCQDVHGVHGSEPCKWQPGFARASDSADLTVFSLERSSASVNRITRRPSASPTLPSALV
eukprot:1468653-Heterocapsa_arctica.AAC.1